MKKLIIAVMLLSPLYSDAGIVEDTFDWIEVIKKSAQVLEPIVKTAFRIEGCIITWKVFKHYGLLSPKEKEVKAAEGSEKCGA